MTAGSAQGEKFVLDALQSVLDCLTDQKTLTWEDLREAAYRWCIRDYAHIEKLADKLGVTHMALIHCSLLFIEHPLLVRPGGGWIYPPVRAHAEILRVELLELPVEIPFKNLPESYPQSYPQGCGQNQKSVDKSGLSTDSEDLSTVAPFFSTSLHNPPVYRF